MELYLMQHGSCLSKEIDPDQPLSPVGRDQIHKSADAIRRLGLGFDALVSSPKLRAVQTAEAVVQALGLNAAGLTITESVKAMKRPEETLDFLRSLRAESIFVAGHLPNLGELAAHLLCGPGKFRLNIENGGLLRIDADQLPTNAAVLRWMLSPMQLQLIANS